MTDRVQLRGICQCCGREQAVIKGHMSKHGYEVKDRGQYGWFSGVCTGESYAPMEISREQADEIIRTVRIDATKLLNKADAFLKGTVKPLWAKTGRKVEKPGTPYWEWEDELVHFAEAPASNQAEAVRDAAWAAKQRGEAGMRFAANLEQLADRWHGRRLREVKPAEPPDPILAGERRLGQRGALTVTHIDRARVYWKDARGMRGWTGTRAWRQLEKA